jgi:hypothetical protein
MTKLFAILRTRLKCQILKREDKDSLISDQVWPKRNKKPRTPVEYLTTTAKTSQQNDQFLGNLTMKGGGGGVSTEIVFGSFLFCQRYT